MLRVIDAAPLPNHAEAERIRVETAQKVSGELNVHWDQRSVMDPTTHNILSFAGIKCRVIGTFFLDDIAWKDDPSKQIPILRFGSDISNYYPNRGLKVYKPNDEALSTIVNYRDPTRPDQLSKSQVTIGEVRYASTNRAYQGISNVKIHISPVDLLDQKTALFGMTRTGKSNTTKVILKSVFDLRFLQENPLRIGQIVFDPNGEYANENVQDENKQRNPSALKNIWQTNSIGQKQDIVTYGINEHPNDPDRKLMLINFYNENMLQVGKDIIDNLLMGDNAQYIRNFRQVKIELPKKSDYDNDQQYQGALTRLNRRVLAYRSLLKKAGFAVPKNLKPLLSRLFSDKLLEIMENVELDKKDKKKQQQIRTAAEILRKASPSWDSLSTAFEGLFYFLDTGAFEDFDKEYIKTSSTGESWADADLIRILEMFTFRKGQI